MAKTPMNDPSKNPALAAGLEAQIPEDQLPPEE